MKKTTKYFTIFALLIMVLSLGIGVAKWNIHYQKPIDTSINTGPTHGEGDGKIDLIDYYINVADGAKVADPYQYQMASGGGIANGSVEYSYQYDPNYTQGPSLSMDGAQYNLQGSTKPSTVNNLTDTMFEESYRLNRVPFSAAKKTGGRHMIDKGFNSELVVEYDDENNVMTVTVNYTVAGRSTVYSSQLTLNYDGTTPPLTYNETFIEGVGYSYFIAEYYEESAYTLSFVFGKDKDFNFSKRSFGRFYTVPANTNDCWTTEKPKNAGIYTYKVKVKDTEANPYLIDGGEKTVDFAILPKTNDGTTSCTYESPAQTQMLSYRLADSLGNAETATVDGETVYFVTYNGATFDIQITASGTDYFKVGIHGNTSEVSNGQKEILRSGDTLKFADDSAVTLNHCNVAQAWSENPNYILTNPYRYYLILPAKFENVNVPDFTETFNPNTETLDGIPYTIDQNALQATCTSINGQTATWSFSKNNASFSSSLTATNVADSGEYYYKIEADNHVPATGSFTVTINKFKVNVPGKDTTTFVYNASEQTYTPVADEGHDIYYTVSTNKRKPAGNQDVKVTLIKTDNYEWSASLPTYTFTIAPAPLSITAVDKSITYGDEAPVYTETYSGFVGGENKGVLTGELTLSCTYAKGNDAGTYPITPSGLTSTNYKITFDGGTLTVERKGLVRPTASVKTYIYNGSAQKFELSGFDSSTMGVSNDTRTDAGSQQVEISIKNKTNYCWSDKSDSDFELTFTIVGKTISLNWSNTTLTYNGAPQKPTAEATGVISGDTVAVTVEGAQTAAGNYTATASINNGNYVLDDSKTQSFTIAPKEITVVWNVGTYEYNGSPQGPTATATGLIGNDTLTLTVTGYGTDAGNYTAVVEAFTSGNYKLSENSEKAYTIEKKPISGSFKFNKTEYVETHTGNPISVLTNGGVQLVNSDGSAIDTDSFKVEYSGDVSATEVGNYTLTATVSAASGNYSMESVAYNFAWSIKASVQSVARPTAVNQDYTYTGSAQKFALDGFNENAMTIDGNVQTNAGEYTVTVTLKSGYQWEDGEVNEVITFDFPIAKASLTITAKGVTIKYNDPVPNYEVDYNEFVGGENESVLTGTLTLSCAYAKGNDAGTYTITPSGLTSTNYEIKYVAGTLTVSKQSVTKPTAVEKTYTYNGDEQEFALDNFNGDLMSITGHIQTNAGTHTVTVSLKNTVNYQWADGTTTDLTFNFTITAKKIAVPTLSLSNAPAGITVAWGQTASFPYDGQDHTLAVNGNGEGYTVTYTNGQIGRTTGSYGVTVELVNSNYAWRDGSTSSLTYTYTINKIVVTIPTPDTTAIPYDGTEHTFSVAASDYYTSTPVTGTNAGTYTVTADLKDKDNYIWLDVTIAEKSFTFTIAKVTYDLTGIKWNYNGEPFANNGEEHEVKLVKADGSELPALPAGKITLVYSNNKQAEAGNYTAQATFTIVDTTNYEFTTGGTAINETSFVYEQDWSIIDKGTITASVADFSAGFKGDAYTLNASTLTVTAESSTGQTTEFTWYFSKTNDFSAEATSINVTNVNDSGTYYYMVVADNHEPATGSFVVNITPAKPIFELQLSTSSALEGDVVTATIVIKDVKGNVNTNIGYLAPIVYVNESNIVLYNNGNANITETPDTPVSHTVTVQYKFYRFTSANYVQECNGVLSETVSVLPVAYLGGSSTYYGTIEKALANNTSGTIYVIPGRNPTIRTNCTIKSGVTLCLPYEGILWNETANGQHTLASHHAYLSPATYRKSNVTVNENVTVTNNGTLQIGGIVTGGNGGYNAGFTSGNYAQITLGDNAKLNSYGTIVCYGYIDETSHGNNGVGNGSQITIHGGSMTAPFTVIEHRGGTIFAGRAGGLLANIGGALIGGTVNAELDTAAFNRFLMANIITKMTIKSTGSLKGYADLYANEQHNITTINLIGSASGNLITLASGSEVDIKYDPTNQKTKFDIYGSFNLNSMSLSIKVNIKLKDVTVNISTKDILFPISHYYDITLNKFRNGNPATAQSQTQGVKILPGASVTVNEGVTLTLPRLAVINEFNDVSDIKYPSDKEPGVFILKGTARVDQLGGFIQADGNTGSLITQAITVTENEITAEGNATTAAQTKEVKYTATGYFVNDLYGGVSSTVSEFASNTTYYSTGSAWYASGTYTATFYGNGGTFANGATSATSTGTNGAALTCPTPTRNGYSLTGWVDGAGNVYSLSDTLIYYGNVTLTAQWTEATYIVTLNANGGKINGSSTTTTSATYNSKYGALPTPTRTGYTFDGWWTAVSGGDQITANTTVTITSAQTLYAHWTANKYDVTFNYNFGDNPTVATDKIAYNTTYSTVMPDVEVPDGYEFLGWWTAAEGGAQVNASDVYTLTTGQTLYAHWNELADYVLVTYLDNSGNQLATNVKTSLGTAYSYNYLVPGYIVSWSDESGNAAVPLDATIGATVTVTATLTPITYTVVYDTDGGSEVAEQIVKYGESFTLPTSTKEGHSLTWSVNSESKKAGDTVSNLTTIANATVTITADWSINQYTITFYDSDGTTVISSITDDFGATITAPQNPNKAGYNFGGWNTTIPTTMPAENISITVNKWEPKKYYIQITSTGTDGSFISGGSDRTFIVKVNDEEYRATGTKGGWMGSGKTGDPVSITITAEQTLTISTNTTNTTIKVGNITLTKGETYTLTDFLAWGLSEDQNNPTTIAGTG